jgi:hypothetical protein
MSFALALTAGPPAEAARSEFNPSLPCSEVLVYEDVIDKVLVGAWASGYLASAEGRLRVMRPAELGKILGLLQKRCEANPELRFSTLVRGIAQQAAAQPRSDASVSGRQLLRSFFYDGADHVAITASLKPRPEDIRAVYGEPLASKLIAMYGELYGPGTVIGPKPDHEDLITIFTTTGKLRSGDAVLDRFPGGYKKVLKYFVADVPIGRFKFVRAGESRGLAFDGLIFVNGRWVLMPKPWRALE